MRQAVAVVVGVEQRQLLGAVRFVPGVVDVEHDALRHRHPAVAEQIDHRRHHAPQGAPAGRVLQARHGRLRAQRIGAVGKPSQRHLEGRVVAQGVAVVAVFVTGGDGEHAKAQHFGDGVVDARGIARIREAAREPLGDPEPALDFAQKENAGVRGEAPAVEGGADFLAADGWQIEGKKAIVSHGGCGAPVGSCGVRLDNQNIHEINTLCYIRQPKIAPLVNNPG